MNARTSQVPLLTALLFVTAAWFGVWTLLRSEERPQPVRTPVVTATETTPRAAAPLAAPLRLDDAQRTDPNVVNARAGRENFDLARATELTCQLVLPEGGMLGPTTEIVAVEIASGTIDLPATQEILTRRLAMTGARFSRGSVGPDGTAVLPLPTDAEQIALFVDDRFLYLEYAVMVVPRELESEVVLEAKFGSCFAAQAQLPTGADTAGLAGVTFDLVLGDRRTLDPILELVDVRQAPEQTFATVTANAAGEAEFRGLTSNGPFRLRAHHPQWVSAETQDARTLVPGSLTEATLTLGRGATVAGRIVDEHHQALAGARVWFEFEASALVTGQPVSRRDSILTDGSGRFRFDGLNLGTLVVLANAPGRLQTAHAAISLSSVGESVELELSLLPRPELRGVVRWQNGSPASACEVRIVAADFVAPADHWNYAHVPDLRITSTDDSGRFLFSDLDAVDCEVFARCKPSLDARAPEWSARLARVAAGTKSIELELAPPTTVRGTVVDQHGDLIEGPFAITARLLSLIARHEQEAEVHEFVHSLGEFELPGLMAGTWSFEASVAGFGPSLHGAEPKLHSLTLPHESTVKIDLQQLARIKVRVLDPNGTPAPQAMVTPTFPGDDAQNSPSKLRNEGPSEWGITDDQGELVLELALTEALELVARDATWTASEPVLVSPSAETLLHEVVLRLRN